MIVVFRPAPQSSRELPHDRADRAAAPQESAAATRLPASLPKARSRTSHGFTRAAAEGRFVLQRCGACGAFAYPAREALSGLPFGGYCLRGCRRRAARSFPKRRCGCRAMSISANARRGGSALSEWNADRRMIAHLHADWQEGNPVVMSLQLDKSGQAVPSRTPSVRHPI